MRSDIRPVTRWNSAERAWETGRRGYSVFSDPRLNKGTAFSDSERAALGLTGLLPSRVLTLDQQAERAYRQCSQQPSALDKNIYLTALHDRNEVLFYRVLTDHLSELLPIVYTPTIGEAIQRYSHQYRRPRGVYLSIDAPGQIETACAPLDCLPMRCTSSSPPTPRPSSASATGASGASISRSASSPSTPLRPASTRPGPCRWCWTSAPTGQSCWRTPCIWAFGTGGLPRSPMTPSSTPT